MQIPPYLNVFNNLLGSVLRYFAIRVECDFVDLKWEPIIRTPRCIQWVTILYIKI